MNWCVKVIRVLSLINLASLEVCRLSAVVLSAGIAVVVAVGVFWRYVLNDSLSWYEEMAKFMMVWLVFVAAPIALRVGDHISIEMFPNLLPSRLRSTLLAAISLVVSGFCGMLAYVSFQFAWNGRTQVAIAIGDVSMFWIFVSIPIGAAIMFLIASQQVFENLLDAFAPGLRETDRFETKYGPDLRDVG
ncbi:TRAP transporter small permease [Pelagibius sp. Alg239-R121]|uniref:TRAP transporter small permease n=1 Tax=Pelagibius sp. Alg239-R121 TaxID=2993448 RepID=UPI0024A654BB|nr:TRAP transporter small permease [Pelagibius sp. Alg239-R121]